MSSPKRSKSDEVRAMAESITRNLGVEADRIVFVNEKTGEERTLAEKVDLAELADEEPRDTTELLRDLRGGWGRGVCDFCHEATEAQDLHPEEADQWICTDCMVEQERALHLRGE